ncbi:MAG: hypothetical protein GY810_25315 [Aureispira sp.]|nr:hypothetical protein [Aureispira sp.]
MVILGKIYGSEVGCLDRKTGKVHNRLDIRSEEIRHIGLTASEEYFYCITMNHASSVVLYATDGNEWKSIELPHTFKKFNKTVCMQKLSDNKIAIGIANDILVYDISF